MCDSHSGHNKPSIGKPRISKKSRGRVAPPTKIEVEIKKRLAENAKIEAKRYLVKMKLQPSQSS